MYYPIDVYLLLAFQRISKNIQKAFVENYEKIIITKYFHVNYPTVTTGTMDFIIINFIQFEIWIKSLLMKFKLTLIDELRV